MQVIDPATRPRPAALRARLATAKLPLIIVLTHKDVLAAEGREVDLEQLERTKRSRRPRERAARHILLAAQVCSY